MKKNEMDVPKVEKVGVVGKLVRSIETSGHASKKMRKVETGDRKIEEVGEDDPDE